MRQQAVLAGPRGRRLCWELLGSIDYSVAPDDVASAVVASRARFSADGTQAQNYLIMGLRACVGTARYWQDPDEDDLLLMSSGASASLEPVAEQSDRPAEHASTTEALRAWRDQTVADNERMEQDRATKGETPT